MEVIKSCAVMGRIVGKNEGLKRHSHVSRDILPLLQVRNKGETALGNRGETEVMDFLVTCTFP